MSKFGVPQAEEGEQRKALVKDANVEQLLVLILKEMKLMNMHLNELTDINISSEEVEI